MSGTPPASTESPVSPLVSDRKSTKRKIDDALYNLDQALRSSGDIAKPPAKKSRLPGSLYSALAKYGIKTSRSNSSSDSKSDEISIIKKSAPHLSAILSRAASKKEKTAHREELARASVTSISAATQQPTTLEYRPSSTTSFLNRLSTFKLSTFSTKPSQIDAVAASKAGWVNEGKERLLCGICKASWILASRDGMTRDAGNSLVEKQRTYLVQMHKDGCPWRAQQCDDSIYCIPLKAPTALAKEIKTNALEIDNKKVLEGVSIRHPLASSQIQSLLSALSSVETSSHAPTTPEKSAPASEDATPQQETAQTEPSQTAALIAVFGWSLVPPIVEPRPITLSITRSSSISISHAPAMSNATRRTSWNPSSSSISEAGSPLRPSRIPLPRTATSITTRLQRQEASGTKRDESLIHCTLCQRRVGLWTFKNSEEPTASTSTANTPTTPTASRSTTSNSNENPPESTTGPPSRLPVRRPSQMPMTKRQFDLLKEHRSYCPYVVRSTTVPSLSALSTPPSPSNARSASASHSPSHTHPPRPSPSRTSSASSFSFSFSPRNAPSYPGTGGALGDPSVVEGWRAVLAMVMRTGLGKRQRHRALMNVQGVDMRPTSAGSVGEGSRRGSPGSSPVTPSVGMEHEQTDDGMDVEMDGIQAMVQDVKSRGGKDLLRYVKNLFA